VVYIAKASSAKWLKAQNDLKVEYTSKFKVKFKYKTALDYESGEQVGPIHEKIRVLKSYETIP
jgi:hypothetical protein